MADNEPMSDELLEYIRSGVQEGRGWGYVARSMIVELLAEVDRLRSERATQQVAIESWYDKWLSRERTQQLLSENAAMLPIVEAVVNLREDWLGTDEVGTHGYHDYDVEPIIDKARALLAHPAQKE